MAYDDNNKIVSFTMKNEQYDKLKDLADKQTRTLSNYIRVLLDEHIKNVSQPNLFTQDLTK